MDWTSSALEEMVYVFLIKKHESNDHLGVLLLCR